MQNSQDGDDNNNSGYQALLQIPSSQPKKSFCSKLCSCLCPSKPTSQDQVDLLRKPSNLSMNENPDLDLSQHLLKTQSKTTNHQTINALMQPIQVDQHASVNIFQNTQQNQLIVSSQRLNQLQQQYNGQSQQPHQQVQQQQSQHQQQQEQQQLLSQQQSQQQQQLQQQQQQQQQQQLQQQQQQQQQQSLQGQDFQQQQQQQQQEKKLNPQQQQSDNQLSILYGKLHLLEYQDDAVMAQFEKKKFNISKIESASSSFVQLEGHGKPETTSTNRSQPLQEQKQSFSQDSQHIIPDFVLEYIFKSLKPFDIIIESTAGIGTTTFNLCRQFTYVISCENDPNNILQIKQALSNNVVNNYELILGDFSVMRNLKADVSFICPNFLKYHSLPYSSTNDFKIDLVSSQVQPSILQYCISAYKKTKNFVLILTKEANIQQLPQLFTQFFKAVDLLNDEPSSVLVQDIFINEQLEYHVVHYGQSSQITQESEFTLLSQLLITGERSNSMKDAYDINVPEEQLQRITKILQNISVTYNLNNNVLVKYYLQTLKQLNQSSQVTFSNKFFDVIQKMENIKLETIIKQEDNSKLILRSHSQTEKDPDSKMDDKFLANENQGSLLASSIYQKSTVQTKKELKQKFSKKNNEQLKARKKKPTKKSMRQKNFTEEKVQLDQDPSLTDQKIFFSNSYEDAEIDFDEDENEEITEENDEQNIHEDKSNIDQKEGDNDEDGEFVLNKLEDEAHNNGIQNENNIKSQNEVEDL